MRSPHRSHVTSAQPPRNLLTGSTHAPRLSAPPPRSASPPRRPPRCRAAPLGCSPGVPRCRRGAGLHMLARVSLSPWRHGAVPACPLGCARRVRAAATPHFVAPAEPLCVCLRSLPTTHITTTTIPNPASLPLVTPTPRRGVFSSCTRNSSACRTCRPSCSNGSSRPMRRRSPPTHPAETPPRTWSLLEGTSYKAHGMVQREKYGRVCMELSKLHLGTSK